MKSAAYKSDGLLTISRGFRPGFRMRRSVMALVISFTGLGITSAQTMPQERLVSTPDPVSGRNPNAVDQITPADCLARIQLLSVELEEIRRVMGKPKTKENGMRIEDAQPREVLYQAQTLYRKADRLAFENTGTSHTPPVTSSSAIRPVHVWKIIDASLKRIRHVKNRFGIVAEFTEMQQPETTVPSDVFLSILNTNRQLNSLLTKEFAPANVFQQVTVAVHYASIMLEQFDQSVATIEAPEFEEAKIPAQVYDLLMICFEIIRKMETTFGAEVLTLRLPEGGVGDISPSDVYDIASLLVAELAYLHAQIPDANPPERAYYPGLKFPSHVFQRAELLRRQLVTLQRFENTNRYGNK